MRRVGLDFGQYPCYHPSCPGRASRTESIQILGHDSLDSGRLEEQIQLFRSTVDLLSACQKRLNMMCFNLTNDQMTPPHFPLSPDDLRESVPHDQSQRILGKCTQWALLSNPTMLPQHECSPVIGP
jgi:hypothetical protein